MDIRGPPPRTRQGNNYILVVMESYTLPNQDAGVVAQTFVEGFLCQHWIPEELHIDQGQNFESQLLKKKSVQSLVNLEHQDNKHH